MIGLDAGVLRRYLTGEDEAVADAVADLVGGWERVQISALVLLELIHALHRPPYALENPALADALIDLLTHENVRLTGLDQSLAAAAIRRVREKDPCHIVDALTDAATFDGSARVLVTADRAFTGDLVPVIVIP